MTQLFLLLGSKLKLIPDWLWVLLMFIVGILAIQFWIAGKFDEGFEAGAKEERAEATQILIQRVDKAHDAKEAVLNPAGAARYNECLLSARTPQNCERFLPQ